jgi:uncharacterized protein
MGCPVSKIITVILLVILGVYLFKRLAGQKGAPPRKPENKAAEDMVRCQVCGVNLPRSEAILSQGHFYCCDEHRRVNS